MFETLFSQPWFFIASLVAFLLALTVHEFSHALVGTFLGDQTAKRMGRLTLNPVAHIDLLGLLSVFFIGFGWAKPVPFNPYNLRWPKWGPVAVAFAGPFSNLILSVLSIFFYMLLGPRLGPDNLLVFFLARSAVLNIALLIFNLIPLPPLDGSKALLAVLAGPQFETARVKLETMGPTLLLILIVADGFLHLGLFSWISFLGISFVEAVATVFSRIL